MDNLVIVARQLNCGELGTTLKINKTLELPTGSLHFEGTLEGEELDYVLECGLNFLAYNNLLPMVKRSVDTPIPESNGIYEQ